MDIAETLDILLNENLNHGNDNSIVINSKFENDLKCNIWKNNSKLTWAA
jgi:hypothetical protein